MADPQVESFLYQEALFMDEHRFDEWLSLWDDPAQYWVPCNADDIDPTRRVSLIYDDRRAAGAAGRAAEERDGSQAWILCHGCGA